MLYGGVWSHADCHTMLVEPLEILCAEAVDALASRAGKLKAEDLPCI